MLSLFSCALMAAVPCLFPPISHADQREPEVVLRAVRFYRADQDQTRVKGLVQIPFTLLKSAQAGGELKYTVSVQVADATGLVLYKQSWQSRARSPGLDTDAYTVEIVDFAVAPGKYRLEAAVQDSASGRKMSTSTTFQALSDSSVASDLLIAPEMRLATSSDTVPRPGEFRTGNNLVTATARVLLTPLRPKIFYLLEAYARNEAEGLLSVAIHDSAGGTITKTPPLAVQASAGGSLLKGSLDLDGLPPGDYTMVAHLQLDGRTIERTAEFSMAGLTETLARDSSRREIERDSDAGYFGSMSDAELDQAQAPLLYIAESRELSPWNDKLSTAAKRRFLTNFWKQRDPTPGTARNERRESFYGAVAYANREFKEGGRNAVSGWRSDRGRIYAKNGAPQEVLRRQQEGRAPPYEVWRYASGRGDYYIFVDESGFGAYKLVYTSDRQEPSLPGWTELLGSPAVADAGRFLGVDLSSASRRF